MTNKYIQLNNQYNELGYFVVRDYFSQSEIQALRKVVLTFHRAWIADNETFYKQEAFNSSVITGNTYLADDDRMALFEFIGSTKVMNMINAVIANKPAFMNTQLFFNPVNPCLKDFWHRDCQYDHDIEMQKQVIHDTQVVHLRVPLFNELGMELVPGTHKRWDSEEEFNVRQEVNGMESSDPLSMGEKIPLSAGDLLVFSADMIHRGLYGLDRLALDILVFDSQADFADYVDEQCLPSTDMLEQLIDPSLFLNTMTLKSISCREGI